MYTLVEVKCICTHDEVKFICIYSIASKCTVYTKRKHVTIHNFQRPFDYDIFIRALRAIGFIQQLGEQTQKRKKNRLFGDHLVSIEPERSLVFAGVVKFVRDAAVDVGAIARHGAGAVEASDVVGATHWELVIVARVGAATRLRTR